MYHISREKRKLSSSYNIKYVLLVKAGFCLLTLAFNFLTNRVANTSGPNRNMYKYHLVTKSLGAAACSPLLGLHLLGFAGKKLHKFNCTFPALAFQQTLCLHTATEPHSHCDGQIKSQRDANRRMKYVLVTGGVVSGLGKGVTASSIGVVLKACGLRVTSIKIGLV